MSAHEDLSAPVGPAAEIRWPKRVTKERLRQLYLSEADGLLDEELLDEVGITLYLRCQAILDIERAQSEGLVRCPRCQQAGRESWLRREHASRETPQPLLTCGLCGWTLSWSEYAASYRRRQLNLGGAGAYFGAYVDAYPRLQTARDKMLAVDRLIHAFHYSLRADPTLPTRPAAVNLIEGRLTDIVPFLDELTYGIGSPRLLETRREWEVAMARWTREYATWAPFGRGGGDDGKDELVLIRTTWQRRADVARDAAMARRPHLHVQARGRGSLERRRCDAT